MAVRAPFGPPSRLRIILFHSMSLFEQDFLMRQIQYLTQLLQEVIFKKSQNRPREAIQLIDNALQEVNRKNHREFHQLTLEETLLLFRRSGGFEAELAVATADLLRTKVEMEGKHPVSRSRKCALQALLLYKKALLTEDASVPLDINQNIKQLEERLFDANALKKLNKLLYTNS